MTTSSKEERQNGKCVLPYPESIVSNLYVFFPITLFPFFLVRQNGKIVFAGKPAPRLLSDTAAKDSRQMTTEHVKQRELNEKRANKKYKTVQQSGLTRVKSKG